MQTTSYIKGTTLAFILGAYHGLSRPMFLSILPLLLIKIALAFDLRLIFSGSCKRMAMTVRASCSVFLAGVLTFDKS